MVGRKGDCGGTPRVGSAGDPKPRRGGRGRRGNGNRNRRGNRENLSWISN